MHRFSRCNTLIRLALLILVLVLFLPHLHGFIKAFLSTLDETGRLIVDLVEIGFVALIIAALLSPLETLGWWAGVWRSR